MPTGDNANLPFVFTSSRSQRLFYRCLTQFSSFCLASQWFYMIQSPYKLALSRAMRLLSFYTH